VQYSFSMWRPIAAAMLGLVCLSGLPLPRRASAAAETALTASHSRGVGQPGFELNRGQADPHTRFVLRSPACTLALASGGSATWFWSGTSPLALRMRLSRADTSSKAEGVGLQHGVSNYLAGSDGRHWLTGIPRYARVRFSKVYPGIDMLYRGRGGEFDFLIAPRANPAGILLEYPDAQELRLSEGGDLLIGVSGQVVVQHRPVAYQIENGARVLRRSGYRIQDRYRVAFVLGEYDRSRELVIDPVLSYSALLPGTAATVDPDGNVYITGAISQGPKPPTASGVSGGCGPVFCSGFFIAKLRQDGSSLEYLTYISSNVSFSSSPPLIAADTSGAVYLAGLTNAPDFPVTTGQKPDSSTHSFALKLNPAGNALAYATLLPSLPPVSAIAVDTAGALYSVGTTGAGLATTAGAMIPKHDGGTCVSPYFAPTSYPCYRAFAAKLNAAGTAFEYVSYLAAGGSWAESHARVVTVDSAGDAFIGGWSAAGSVAPTPGAMGPECLSYPSGYVYIDIANAFVLKLDPKGGRSLYTSVFGCDAGITGIALDSGGNAYASGSATNTTWEAASVPYLSVRTTPAAFQQTIDYNCDARDGQYGGFAAKLNAQGSAFAYATYVGLCGSRVDGIAIDAAGDAYVAGSTRSKTFPVTVDALKPTIGLNSDAFLSELNPSGSSLLYSTYLGDGGVINFVSSNEEYTAGAFTDRNGAVYVVGSTSSPDFPILNPPSLPDGGFPQLFVSKFIDAAAAPRPAIKPDGVVNSASLLPAAVADGEIVSIFGSSLGPQSPVMYHLTNSGLVDALVGNVRVLVNGIPAPILFAQANQINAMLPALSTSSTQIQIEYQGRKSDAIAIPTAAGPSGATWLHSSPGLFTITGTGLGQAAVLNQDLTGNSAGNPAARGSIVSLFGTGSGPFDSYPPPGTIVSTPLPKPQLPVSVTIGGIDSQVKYAGGAPGLVTGVLQVNVLIPAGAPVGDSVPVVLTVGPSKSQAGVTIAIR